MTYSYDSSPAGTGSSRQDRLVDNDDSCLYTDWFHGTDDVGDPNRRSIQNSPLPIIIEEPSSMGDDIWQELNLPHHNDERVSDTHMADTSYCIAEAVSNFTSGGTQLQEKVVSPPRDKLMSVIGIHWWDIGVETFIQPSQRKIMEAEAAGNTIRSTLARPSNQQPGESCWAEQLLTLCATAIASKNIVRTQHLMWVLNDLASLTGDANQRLAAYGLKALFCRITSGDESVASYDMRLAINQVGTLGPKTVHRALLKFHEVNPWHQMVYTVANASLLQSFVGHSHLHVIDIGVSQGTQWPLFIDALVTRVSGPPALLRITTLKDQGTPLTADAQMSSSSGEFTDRLVKFANLMGLNVELDTVVGSLETITRENLNLRKGEVLAVCAQFRLHRLSDEIDVSTEAPPNGVISPSKASSPRDAFLHFLRELEPRVLILSDNDTDHLSPDLLPRFHNVTRYFWKFLDSSSAAFHGQDSEDRQIIEYEAAMTMLNNVACEGTARVERNETHVGWGRRMERVGFVQVLPCKEILDTVHLLLQKYGANWDFSVAGNSVALMWKHQPVTFCSVWKTQSSS